MSTDLHELRAALESRAAATPLEIAAARARLEGRFVRAARPRHPRRRVLVVATAMVLVGMIAVTMQVVAHRRATSAPAAAVPPLPVTDYLFDLDDVRLAAAGLSASFGGADAVSQRAMVYPTGAPANTAYSAVVLVSYDPAGLGVGTRPADATDVTVEGNPGWTAPHVIAGDATAYGIDGSVTTWTDATGLTAKVLATNRAVLDAVTKAVQLGRVHPVTFPASFAPGTFPAGSRLISVETVYDQGSRIEIARPGRPLLAVAVNRLGVNVSSNSPTEPLTAGFRLVLPRLHDVDLLTDGRVNLEVDTGTHPVGGFGPPTLALDDLRSLVGSMTFATSDDPKTWPSVTDAIPLE